MKKGAVIGTGFWSHYQIPAWQEIEGVEIVAVYNRTRKRAESVARKFGIDSVYDSVDELLDKEDIDFIDIITNVETHALFTRKGAEAGVDVICQKPMATGLGEAREMLETCQAHQVNLFIHENFRWQAPIRRVKTLIDAGEIGEVHKARISFCSAFPVYDNQPFLRELEHFIITDVGSHILDVSRFLLGEVSSLYCLTRRVNPSIKGEDVADILMEMRNGSHCFVELSYASILEKEAFPQTLMLIEGSAGSISLTHDFEVKITTREGTRSTAVRPEMYDWLDPDYAVAHSSIVDCNRDILQGLYGGNCETTGEDNFETVRLVWAAYESAETGKAIQL